MKPKNITSIATAFICLLISYQSQSALVSTDWLAPNDNLVTRDTISGLEWLDITETTNISYNAMLTRLSEGSQFEGFRYATETEISSLWINSGFYSTSDFVYGDSTSNTNVDNFISLFGVIETRLEPTFTQFTSWGLYSWDDQTTSGAPIAFVAFRDAFNPSFRARIDDGPWDPEVSGEWLGSWLVRDATVVPIPPSIYLFVAGFIGLVGITKRNLKK